jgi:hypothetical protein
MHIHACRYTGIPHTCVYAVLRQVHLDVSAHVDEHVFAMADHYISFPCIQLYSSRMGHACHLACDTWQTRLCSRCMNVACQNLFTAHAHIPTDDVVCGWMQATAEELASHDQAPQTMLEVFTARAKGSK